MPTARRGPLTLLLILALPLLALGWLRSGDGTAASGSRYVEAVVGTPARISPLSVRGNEVEGDLVQLIFAGLMRLGPDGTPLPDLAASWEVTPDALTYTFHLRPNLAWHDGVAVDAEDVAYTIGRIQAAEFSGSSALAAEWANVQVFVADPLTVLIRLPEPAANFLARATLGLVPRHLASQMEAPGGFDVSPFERRPVGAGPYRLASLDDERAVLERHTTYGLGPPAIARIELRFADDAEEQAAMLRDGRVDAALFAEQPTEAEIAALARRSDLATVVLQRNASTVLYFNNLRGPLASAPLRRAVAAAIDPAAALETAGLPRSTPGDGVIVQGTWAHGPIEVTQPPLAGLWIAASVLNAPDGTKMRGDRPLAFSLVTNADPERESLALAIAEQLRAAGVTVEVTVEPAQRVVSEYLRTGAYDMVLFGWENAPDPDPYTGWHTSQIGGAGGNVASFSDAETDALLEAARTTLDVGERRELYSLFAQRFEELGASLVVAYPQRLYAYPASLHGFEPGLLFTPASRFASVHQWALDE